MIDPFLLSLPSPPLLSFPSSPLLSLPSPPLLSFPTSAMPSIFKKRSRRRHTASNAEETRLAVDAARKAISKENLHALPDSDANHTKAKGKERSKHTEPHLGSEDSTSNASSQVLYVAMVTIKACHMHNLPCSHVWQLTHVHMYVCTYMQSVSHRHCNQQETIQGPHMVSSDFPQHQWCQYPVPSFIGIVDCQCAYSIV